ncbi:hypothetical protein L1987_34525 [Smallanthus sonchifolius]|uniref:Uncharacterized protein n=1 Tax=Smallanthus sonchifolius TaxID=185202 RepID=A0ACB9HV99_9ASTR|nr:hypothetical protein L1987_34525 [Smallanthus sonchifolius]
MKDRRKRGSLLLFVFGCTFSTLRLLFTERYHPNLVSSWRTSPVEVISGDSPTERGVFIGETVLFPDQVLILLKYPPSSPLLTKDEIDCVYSSPNTSRRSSPLSIGGEYLDYQIVRCEIPARGTIASVSLKAQGDLPPGPTRDWKSLAYEAMIDRDNTTVVFVKGLNLRSGRPSNASKFLCVYGSDLTNRQLLLRSEVVSIAQEIVRCRTPLNILEQALHKGKIDSLKVSVKIKGRGVLGSIA